MKIRHAQQQVAVSMLRAWVNTEDLDLRQVAAEFSQREQRRYSAAEVETMIKSTLKRLWVGR